MSGSGEPGLSDSVERTGCPVANGALSNVEGSLVSQLVVMAHVGLAEVPFCTRFSSAVAV